jgi:hypothetical protein
MPRKSTKAPSSTEEKPKRKPGRPAKKNAVKVGQVDEKQVVQESELPEDLTTLDEIGEGKNSTINQQLDEARRELSQLKKINDDLLNSLENYKYRVKELSAQVRKSSAQNHQLHVENTMLKSRIR